MMHIIRIIARDDTSVLNRITDVLRRKRFVVDRITMTRDAAHNLMHITLIVDAAHEITEQVIRQLTKLVDVFEIDDMTRDEHGFLHEFVLVKAPKEHDMQPLIDEHPHVSVKQLDREHPEKVFFSVSGDYDDVAKLVGELSERDVYDIIRTGPLYKG